MYALVAQAPPILARHRGSDVSCYAGLVGFGLGAVPFRNGTDHLQQARLKSSAVWPGQIIFKGHGSPSLLELLDLAGLINQMYFDTGERNENTRHHPSG